MISCLSSVFLQRFPQFFHDFGSMGMDSLKRGFFTPFSGQFSRRCGTPHDYSGSIMGIQALFASSEWILSCSNSPHAQLSRIPSKTSLRRLNPLFCFSRSIDPCRSAKEMGESLFSMRVLVKSILRKWRNKRTGQER